MKDATYYPLAYVINKKPGVYNWSQYLDYEEQNIDLFVDLVWGKFGGITKEELRTSIKKDIRKAFESQGL